MTLGDVLNVAVADGFRDEQVEDLAELFARELGVDDIEALAKTFLGDKAVREAGDRVADIHEFAQVLIAALRRAGRLSEAVTRVRQDAPLASTLSTALAHILAGGRLSDAALQARTHEYQPYFHSQAFVERVQSVSRKICLIGLGMPHNVLKGSGFLVGPDLVMTNYHVIQQCIDDDGVSIRPKINGDQIICFFDYLTEPTPELPYVPRPRDAFTGVPAAAEDWLLHARPKLPWEGQAKCPLAAENRYDYAVIRLSRRVGKVPLRRSGGTARGWLELPHEVDVTPDKRVILHQHPEAKPLQFDVGRYAGPDPTETRVRYTMSSDRGSSGAVAIDVSGQLFALHTARVVPPAAPAAQRLNQGVRIDYIARDLAENVPEWNAFDELDERPFWSLSDDLNDPRPIIGRDDFREHVETVHAGRGPRVVAVWGPPGCGLQYSVRLLRRVVGAATRVVEFTTENLACYSPQQFLRALVNALGLTGFADRPIPHPNPHEGLNGWLRSDLPRWLLAVLEDNAKRRQVQFPVWLVFKIAVPPGERFMWADHLTDLITAIAGTDQPGPSRVQIPHLRLLFLASSLDSIPIPPAYRLDDDLSEYVAGEADFIACMRRAWHSVDQEENAGPQEVLGKIARQSMEGKETASHRKSLSESIREIVLDRLGRRAE